MPGAKSDERTLLQQPPREEEVLSSLRKGELALPPVSLRLLEARPTTSAGSQPDGILEARWRDRSARYVFEYKALSTPQAVEMATGQAYRYGAEMQLPPLIIVPFLSEERLRNLEAQSISAIDLSGNGVLVGPDIYLWRSGSPNRYKDSQPIKNIYRGVSSVFARCFLLRPEFSSLTELREFANSRLSIGLPASSEESRLVKSTASKVVQALEAERIIDREADGLRLIDSARLLNRLQNSYRAPTGRRLEGKTALSREEVWQRLRAASLSSEPLQSVTTGLGSAARYGVLSGPERISLYVTDLAKVADLLEVRATRAFPNIDLIEEKGEVAFFDARRDGAVLWASPVQTWLELTCGGPREQDAAQTLETALLQRRTEEIL